MLWRTVLELYFGKTQSLVLNCDLMRREQVRNQGLDSLRPSTLVNEATIQPRFVNSHQKFPLKPSTYSFSQFKPKASFFYAKSSYKNKQSHLHPAKMTLYETEDIKCSNKSTEKRIE